MVIIQESKSRIPEIKSQEKTIAAMIASPDQHSGNPHDTQEVCNPDEDKLHESLLLCRGP
jgi:hypothetical protein